VGFPRAAAAGPAPAARRPPASAPRPQTVRALRRGRGVEPMNPQRRRRLLLVLGLVLASDMATDLVAMALQRNVAYLYTPAEVLRGEAGERARFRIGGIVEKGSFERPAGSMEASFRVT